MTLDQAITELRKRNQKVPLPLRLPSRNEVQETEQRLGLYFHPDFVHYLLHASDIAYGTKEPVTITRPTAHTHLESVARDAWTKMELPKNLLPICEDNGDYFCMDQSGRVVYWSHDGAANESWPDLATWIADVWIGESG
jgi:hypothetical protein